MATQVRPSPRRSALRPPPRRAPQALDRLSISLPEELGIRIRRNARRQKQSISVYLEGLIAGVYDAQEAARTVPPEG